MEQEKFSHWAVILIILSMPFTVFAKDYKQALFDAINDAKRSTPVVALDQFKEAIDDPSIWIIDVREPNEYARGHIRSAINIPRGLIEFKIWKKVGYPEKTNMAQKMYLYCAVGGRCALAAKSLRDLGFSEVYRTDLNIKQWVKAGNELVK